MTQKEIIDSILLCIEIEGDGGCSSFKNEEKEQMCSFINSLKQQPTLPSNVDEAANAYVGHPIEIDEDSSCYTTREAFKAGAEWMAKQGVSLEDELAYYDGLLLCGKDERAYTMESKRITNRPDSYYNKVQKYIEDMTKRSAPYMYLK